MKRPAQSANRLERTDAHLIDALHRLSPQRQKEIAGLVFDEAAAAEQVMPFQQLLLHPEVREEARRLARDSGISISELADIVDPRVYSSAFARSHRCTMAKLVRAEVDPPEVTVDVKVHEDLMQRHHLLPPQGFVVHVVFGAITISAGGHAEMIQERKTVTIPVGHPEIVIHASQGAWFKYVPHPLSAWISTQKVGSL